MLVNKSFLNYIKKNNSSNESKYSTEALNEMNEISLSEDTAAALIMIQKDNSYSFEHWDNLVREKISEGILMSHLSLEPIRERNRQKAMLKDMRRQSFSVEDCNRVIEIMSMEGIAEFAQNAKNLAVNLWEKLMEALAAFKRMIGRILRAPWTKPQTKLYDEYKGKISDIVSKIPASEKRSLKNYSISYANVEKRINECITAAKELESKANSFNESSSPSADSIKSVFKFATGSEVRNDDDSGTTLVNKWFFGQTKVPKNQELEIKEVIKDNAFEACSKKFLDDLDKLNEGADRLMRVCGKIIKAIKSSGSANLKDDPEKKDKEKKIRETITAIQNSASFGLIVMRAVFNCSLSYRTNVYRAAKAAIALANQKSDDKK